MVITRQITVLELFDIITDGMPHGSRRTALEGMREQIEGLQAVAAKARLLALGVLGNSACLIDLDWAQAIVDRTVGLPDKEEDRGERIDLPLHPDVGNVYRHRPTGRKVVVSGTRTMSEVNTPEWECVAIEPHGDGDFSYLCGSEFCRCLS